MRRTIALAVFAALGVALALLTAPAGRTRRPMMHGPRAFTLTADAVRRVEVDLGSRRVVADRVPDGWRVDASIASPALREALDALLKELAGLRAVDAFRPSGDLGALGLSPPEGTIALTTARGTQRLELGALNAVGSTFYARREGHRRVLQLGVYLMEIVRRVVSARDAAASSARAYWPEIG
jgi:hypothetical protein